MFCGGSKPRKHQVKPGKMASTQTVILMHLPKCGVEEPFCVCVCVGVQVQHKPNSSQQHHWEA